MNKSEPIAKLWQDQPLSEREPSMQHVTTSAHQFQRKIQRRNLIEYAAAAIGVVWIGFSAATSGAPLVVKIGEVLMTLGALFVVAVLHRFGSAGSPPFDATTREMMTWYRSELERQRDLLLRVPLLYLGPFVPGLSLVFLGGWLANPAAAFEVGLAAAFVALVFASIAFINYRAANQLNTKIEELAAHLEE